MSSGLETKGRRPRRFVITTKPITSAACVIALQGDPDREEVKLLADRLADLVAQGAREIAVDFSQISGVAPSSLLDVLREAAELLEASGGVLLLASQEPGGSHYRLARLHPRRLGRVRGFHPPSPGRSGGGRDGWGRRRGSAL